MVEVGGRGRGRRRDWWQAGQRRPASRPPGPTHDNRRACSLSAWADSRALRSAQSSSTTTCAGAGDNGSAGGASGERWAGWGLEWAAPPHRPTIHPDTSTPDSCLRLELPDGGHHVVAAFSRHVRSADEKHLALGRPAAVPARRTLTFAFH